jgi:hypothetical protein
MRIVWKLAIVVTVLTVAFWGCKEKDVDYTTDQDEIIRLLSRSEPGRDLFRYDSLIIPADYTVPYDNGAVYRDSVTEHRRSIDVNITPNRVNYWYPRGLQTEAIARVIDEFTVKTSVTSADTVTYYTTDRNITRFAMLLQLGNEADPYKGWYLWGFSGDEPSSIDVTVYPQGGVSFPGDGDIYAAVPAANTDYSGNSGFTFGGAKYIRLEDIDTLTDGGQIALETHAINSGGNTRRPMVRISAADDDGFFFRTMTKIDRNNYVDTIKTPTNNSRIWNLIYMQTFHDTEFFFTGAHVIAFRVPVH